MRVLAVGAHPDDLEQLAGGTIAKFGRLGHEVLMCNASTGDRGSYIHSQEEIRAIRADEAAAAAAVLGATHTTLGLSDGEVNASDPAQRLMAVDLIRKARPDVILTHSPNDYMADHVEVSRLMLDASHIATLPLLETGEPCHDVVPAVFYFDTLAGVDFRPTEYVDISEFIDVKMHALGAHESQVRWLQDHDGVDVLEQTRTVSAYRGYQCGVADAEAFAQVATWLRLRPYRLLP